ncbi:hypothetical protein B0H19DRAFT_1274691 [Mycena capillaripes]|nr:hypothetical protein B0H19DRAFT_1274691 [Mycena capillaripes]
MAALSPSVAFPVPLVHQRLGAVTELEIVVARASEEAPTYRGVLRFHMHRGRGPKESVANRTPPPPPLHHLGLAHKDPTPLPGETRAPTPPRALSGSCARPRAKIVPHRGTYAEADARDYTSTSVLPRAKDRTPLPGVCSGRCARPHTCEHPARAQGQRSRPIAGGADAHAYISSSVLRTPNCKDRTPSPVRIRPPALLQFPVGKIARTYIFASTTRAPSAPNAVWHPNSASPHIAAIATHTSAPALPPRRSAPSRSPCGTSIPPRMRPRNPQDRGRSHNELNEHSTHPRSARQAEQKNTSPKHGDSKNAKRTMGYTLHPIPRLGLRPRRTR